MLGKYNWHMTIQSKLSDEANRKGRVHEMFAAIFSHKPDVSKKRLAILKAIDKSTVKRMKFKKILDNVQSLVESSSDYSSQRLTYDLQVLRENSLINRTSEGEYVVTDYGSYLLEVYKGFKYKFSEIDTHQKPSFVGVASGSITAENFDFEKLGLELLKLPFFGRKSIFERDKLCLEWVDDDDDLRSEIQICRDGSFSVEVVLCVTLSEVRGSFVDDLESNEAKHWFKVARGLVQTITFYIERTAHQQWKDCRVVVPLEADSYPFNIYAGVKKDEDITPQSV